MDSPSYIARIFFLLCLVCVSPVWAGPLCDAASKGDLDQVKRLIDEGQDVNEKDERGLSPLHITALFGRAPMAELLIEKGAEIDVRDKDGHTPLHCAAFVGNGPVVKLLVENGAEVNAKATDGVTPLHMAAIVGRANFAELLVSNGADVNVKDNDGRVPLDYAVRNGHLKTAGILKRHGATPLDKEEQVVLSIPRENRTYYFNNDKERLCYTFSLSGKWQPTDEAALLESTERKGRFAGVLLRSEKLLKDYEGKDLLARSVSASIKFVEKELGKPPDSSSVEAFESSYPGSIKWTAKSKFSFRGKTATAIRVRHMAEVKPGWVAVVTAGHFKNDDTARAILKSLRFTSEPECFYPEIRKLKKSN